MVHLIISRSIGQIYGPCERRLRVTAAHKGAIRQPAALGVAEFNNGSMFRAESIFEEKSRNHQVTAGNFHPHVPDEFYAARCLCFKDSRRYGSSRIVRLAIMLLAYFMWNANATKALIETSILLEHYRQLNETTLF